jgi:hypothetical protein
MISRKALLISAPGGDLSNTSAVNSDLETTRNFLLSPRGGAWAHHEIVTLSNPAIHEIAATVAEMNADYTITFFSGKSFSDGGGNRFLILGEGDFIQDVELLNDSGKQLVLVDACPEAFTEEVIHFVGKPDEFHLARRMYDKWIERCEPGQMIMHAHPGTTVDVKNGGVFTQKLLQVASRIPSVENKFNLKSILAAGHEMPILLKTDGTGQGPDISYSRGNIKLPFAMALPAPGKKKGKGGNALGSPGLAIGIFLLGLFLSLE